MALKLIVDTIDSIPEAMRSSYVERDGKFHLDVDGIEDTSDLKSRLTAANKEAADRRKALETWKGIGKTPEEIAALVHAREQDDLSNAEKKGEWEKLKAQMNEKHGVELKAKEDKIAALRSTLEKHLVESVAISEITKEKGVPQLLLPHVQHSVRVVEDNGEFKVRVVDSKGDPRVDGKGEPLTISALVAEMKQNEVYGRAFDAIGNTGSGKQPNSNSGRAGNGGTQILRTDFNALSPIAQREKVAAGVLVVDNPS